MSEDISPKPAYPERYIGDAVYASFDGWHVLLRTGDGNNQRIALDPTVFQNLIAYHKQLMEHFAREREEAAEAVNADKE